MKKTYVQRLKDLNGSFTPAQKHYTTMDEIYRINELLGLDGMSAYELHNLRDMAVMYFDIQASDARERDNDAKYDRAWDLMSAVTAVIDLKIRNAGGEV